MAETKRSLVAHYVNSTPSATAATWELVGEGVSEAQMAMNPQTETQQYVHEDLATTRVTGYQPSMPIEQIVYPGDDLFDFIDAIRQAGPSIGSNDLTELVEVRLYESPDTAGTSYPATQWSVHIQIDNAPGGAGGADASISYTLNVQGAATAGDFNTATLTFS
jgi:hypothetical protein